MSRQTSRSATPSRQSSTEDHPSTFPGGKPPYLAFHLRRGHVAAGMFSDSTLEDFVGNFVPAIVGYTTDNRWVFGVEALALQRDGRSSTKLKQEWSIGNHFAQNKPLKYHIPVKGGLILVGMEVIFAFLLKKLKTASEKHAQQTIHSCVFTVPLYFTSCQRLQVKTACEIAGFRKVQIVSDISAAAFEFAFHSPHFRRSQMKHFAVISEDNGHLYGGIFECDKQTNTIVISVPFGGDLKKLPEFRTLLMNNFHKYSDLLDNHVLLICRESPQPWLTTLINSIKEIRADFTPTPESSYPLQGGVRLSMFRNVGDKAREMVSHPIYVVKDGHVELLLEGDRLLPVETYVTVQGNTFSTHFSQIVFDQCQSQVGELQILKAVKTPQTTPDAHNFYFEVRVELSSDGILGVSSVQGQQYARNPVSMESDVDYRWKCVGSIGKEDIRNYATLINSFT